MGEAIGQSLPFAVGLALSPFPPVAMVLMLGSGRGRANAVVFALAAVGGVAAVGAVVLLVAGGGAVDSEGDPALWVSILRLGLGLLLLTYAARALVFRGRKPKAEGATRWLRALGGLTAARAAGLGLLASALNPKNLVLAVAGAAAIAQADLDAGAAAASLAVLVVIGTLGSTVPLALSLVLGPRGEPALRAVKDRAERNSDLIMALLALVFGATLLGEGIDGLSTA